MLENVYEGLNVRSKVYLSKVYFCEMFPTCVSSKLCEFILLFGVLVLIIFLASGYMQMIWCFGAD